MKNYPDKKTSSHKNIILWYNIFQNDESILLDILSFIETVSLEDIDGNPLPLFSLYCEFVAYKLKKSLTMAVSRTDRPVFCLHSAIFLRNVQFCNPSRKVIQQQNSGIFSENFSTFENIFGHLDQEMEKILCKYIRLGEFFFGLYKEIESHLMTIKSRLCIVKVLDKLFQELEPDCTAADAKLETKSLGEAISDNITPQVGVPLLPTLLGNLFEYDLAFDNYSFLKDIPLAACKNYFYGNTRSVSMGKSIYLKNVNSLKPEGKLQRHVRLGPYRKPIMSLHCESQCMNPYLVKKVLQNILNEITKIELSKPFMQFLGSIDKTLFWTQSSFQTLPCMVKCFGESKKCSIYSTKYSYNVSHHNQEPFVVDDKKVRFNHDLNHLSCESGNIIKKVPVCYSELYRDDKNCVHMMNSQNFLLTNAKGKAVKYSTLTCKFKENKFTYPDIMLEVPCARRLCYERLKTTVSFGNMMTESRLDTSIMKKTCFIECCKEQTCADKFLDEFISEKIEFKTLDQFNKYLQHMESLTEFARKNLCHGCIMYFTCRNKHHDNDFGYVVVRRYILPHLLSYTK